MPVHKVTDFLSEISTFFKKDDTSNAIYTIMDVIKCVKMIEKTLWGITGKCNRIYSLLQVFQTLLIYPRFMIRNPYKFDKSPLIGLMDCPENVFYRFQGGKRFAWVRKMSSPKLCLADRQHVFDDSPIQSTIRHKAVKDL